MRDGGGGVQEAASPPRHAQISSSPVRPCRRELGSLSNHTQRCPRVFAPRLRDSHACCMSMSYYRNCTMSGHRMRPLYVCESPPRTTCKGGAAFRPTFSHFSSNAMSLREFPPLVITATTHSLTRLSDRDPCWSFEVIVSCTLESFPNPDAKLGLH